MDRTQGPFDRLTTELAAWCPAGDRSNRAATKDVGLDLCFGPQSSVNEQHMDLPAWKKLKGHRGVENADCEPEESDGGGDG